MISPLRTWNTRVKHERGKEYFDFILQHGSVNDLKELFKNGAKVDENTKYALFPYQRGIQISELDLKNYF